MADEFCEWSTVERNRRINCRNGIVPDVNKCIELFTRKNEMSSIHVLTVCPRSSDPFYIVSYYIKWVTTSWTYSINKDTYTV